MISALDNAFKTIYRKIPKPILEMAFTPDMFNVTMDQRIKDEVITASVLSDVSIYCGKIKKIPLSSTYLEQTRPDPLYGGGSLITGSAVYRVPPAAREYRDIVQVIDITFPYEYTAYGDAPFGFGGIGNTLKTLSDRALTSRNQWNNGITPQPILQPGNMITINPPNVYVNDWILECRLGFDEEFTGLPLAGVQHLSDLIVMAVKSYIYNKLIIDIDKAALSGGQEIGVVKTIIEKYEDLEQPYKDALDALRGALVVADPDTMRELMLMML